MPRLPANPRLRELEPLIGEWEVAVPAFGGQAGRATFEWLEDGSFLRIASDAPDPVPNATMIVGHDDQGQTSTVLYYDSRGVSRVYLMTFRDREWRMWREAPGFHQRFIGILSDDGRKIRGAWELARDGSTWERDFDIIYTRID